MIQFAHGRQLQLKVGSHVHVVLPLYMVVFCGSELHTGKQKTPELQVWVSGPMLVQGE